MKRTSLLILCILVPAVLLAQGPPPTQVPPPQQTPPATQTPPPQPPARPATPAPRPAAGDGAGASKVAVLDVQRALAENTDGKKAVAQLNAEGTKRQAELESKQKAIQEAQDKLRTQDRLLSDTVKADLTRQIERDTTDLQRATEDAQKAMQDMQAKLLSPIYQLTQKVLSAYANEMGLAVVFDVSNQASSIIYINDLADITTEIIRRLDAEIAKAKPPAGKN
jgi:outer membrane protein